MKYWELIIASLMAFILSWVIIPKISLISYKCHLFDPVSSRKLHQDLIPRLGGIAFFPCIVISSSLSILFCNVIGEQTIPSPGTFNVMLAFLSASFFIFLVGIKDDLIGVSYRVKFIVQFLCGTLFVYAGLYFDNLYGFLGVYQISPIIGMPLTVLIIVYILNAINLIDGIDGLASGLSGIAFFAFGWIFLYLNWEFYSLISFVSFSVLLPFFYYNVYGNAKRGSKIFMGDTGSLTIGLILSLLILKLSVGNCEKDIALPGALVISFSFLLIPLLDVLSVMLKRISRGKSPFLPDKSHIHHRLIAIGCTPRQALVILLLLAVMFIFINTILSVRLDITLLFIIDLLIWTLMYVFIEKLQKSKNFMSVNL